MHESSAPVPIAVILALIRSNRAPNVRTTPLGVPVVPEVNSKKSRIVEIERWRNG